MSYSGGLGTEASPYMLSTVADFTTLKATTSDYDKYFILVNGIAFESADWCMV